MVNNRKFDRQYLLAASLFDPGDLLLPSSAAPVAPDADDVALWKNIFIRDTICSERNRPLDGVALAAAVAPMDGDPVPVGGCGGCGGSIGSWWNDFVLRMAEEKPSQITIMISLVLP